MTDVPDLSELLIALQKQEQTLAETKGTYDALTEVVEAYAGETKTVRNETAERIYELQKAAQKVREEADARIKEIEEQAQATKTAQWDMRVLLRQQERDRDSLQRQIDQAKRAAESAAEWATLEKRWDLLTMGAPWREWAKDHQLDGARKITWEGRMILGDTMGLGKTGTAIIACDMIEAATKDATPDNPVEFGSK